MEKRYDVVSLGALLIDFTQNGFSDQGNAMLEANPGGSQCNVLSMLSNLDHKVGFIGKVGNDHFGNYLKEVISNIGIDTQGLLMDEEVHTTLAFVHTAPDGDRSFSFYRNPGADMMLRADEVNEYLLKSCRIFHFGLISTTSESCRAATYKAIDIAKENGALISFDPNLRLNLWESLDSAKKVISYGMSKADILKIADDEIIAYTGIEDYDEAVKTLRNEFPNLKLILVSLGKEGSIGYSGNNRVFVAPFLHKNTIETTGAGDTFCALVLHYVIENGLKEEYSCEELNEMLINANAAASIITTKRGALRVMPKREEYEYLVRGRREKESNIN